MSRLLCHASRLGLLKSPNLGPTVFDSCCQRCWFFSASQLWGHERQEESFIWKHSLSSIHSSRMRQIASDMKGVFFYSIKVICILRSSVFTFCLQIMWKKKEKEGNHQWSHRGNGRKNEINKEMKKDSTCKEKRNLLKKTVLSQSSSFLQFPLTKQFRFGMNSQFTDLSVHKPTLTCWVKLNNLHFTSSVPCIVLS